MDLTEILKVLAIEKVDRTEQMKKVQTEGLELFKKKKHRLW